MENIFLAAIYKNPEVQNLNYYPFNIPVIKYLDSLEFRRSVTYIIGENGSGKSTLLEAIAINMGMNVEGGSKNFHFNTNETHSELYEALRMSRTSYYLKDCFFYRAESFYNAVTYLERMGGFAFSSYGGKNLHKMSHGEGLVSLIENRLTKGLYIFDEPEAALSYKNQLRFLLWIKSAVATGSQIIISTHSPVVLAYPNADILCIGDEGLYRTTYEESYIYNDMRVFINTVPMIQRELGLADNGKTD